MNRTATHLLILTSISALVFFINLGGAELWDRDEPRNAGCALEMMERGNLVVPIFNDELRYQKPVLLYWLMISAYQVFGVNEFSARFWSALCGIGTVLLTYGIAARLFDRRVALLSGIALASSLMFVVAARAATPDSVLIFCSTLALWFYARDVFKLPNQTSWFPSDWRNIAGMYIAMGFGVLAKGPVAVVLPMAIIGMFMLIQRLPGRAETVSSSTHPFNKFSEQARQMVTRIARTFHPWHFARTLWAMRPLTCAAIVLLVAAPWYTMVGLQTNGDWLRIFFLDENVGRASTVYENHSGGLWYYPVAILVGFFPWSVFAVPTFLNWRNSVKQSRVGNSAAMVFLACWVGVQVGVFSIASTKLPSYVTPCYPALAMLAACFLIGLVRSQSKQNASDISTDSNRAIQIESRWFKVSLACLVLSGIFMLAALWFASQEYLTNGSWLILLGLLPVCGGIGGLWLAFRRKFSTSVVTLSISAVALVIGFFGFATATVSENQQHSLILNEIRAQHPETTIASYRGLESSWIFYGRKPIFELNENDSIIGSLDRDRFWKPKPRVSPQSFIDGQPDSLIVTSNEHLSELRSKVNCVLEEVASCQYFLKHENLILLRPVPRLARKE